MRLDPAKSFVERVDTQLSRMSRTRSNRRDGDACSRESSHIRRSTSMCRVAFLLFARDGIPGTL